jgi:hypothetical protein
MKGPFEGRSTGEILVLTITFTVCFSVLATGAFVAFLVIIRPETDPTVWVNRVTAILNTLIGLLAGFLAGRTDLTKKTSHESPEHSDK